ncbi:hypothetical protein BB020_08185 [Elizabethkingia occulta]|nr:hypothetical protein BB020_08185 [Elizabethkingia occulta]
MRNFRTIPYLQGVYYLLTGIWPFLSLESFIRITGPKTDIWLVQTVALLLIPYGLLCFYIANNTKKFPVIAMALALCCMSLAGINLYYYLRNSIKWVYSVDFVIEIIFLVYWLFYIAKRKVSEHSK